MYSKILLFGHGGSGNHGCEAIVRSTMRILNQTLPQNECILLSNSIDQERKYGVDKLCSIEDLGKRPKNLRFFLSYINMKLAGKFENFDTYPIRSIIRKNKNNALALSIGGDNYCYGNNSVLAYQNRLFNNAGILYRGKFDSITDNNICSMINVNIFGLTILTKIVLNI